MKYKLSNIKKTAKANNKDLFDKVDIGRCYYCGGFFDPKTIDMWDCGLICFCPLCSIDAIIPISKDYDIEDDNFIEAMALYWFNGYARYTDETMKIEGPEDYDNKFADLIEINTVTIGPKRYLVINIKNSDVERFKQTFIPYVEDVKPDREFSENNTTTFTYFNATNNGYQDEIRALVKTGLSFSGTLGPGRSSMPEKFVTYDGYLVHADTNTDEEFVCTINRKGKAKKKDWDAIKFFQRAERRIQRYFKFKDTEDNIEAIKSYQIDERQLQRHFKSKGIEVVLLE